MSRFEVSNVKQISDINASLADKAHKNGVVYVDDYSNLVTNGDWTTAIQTAFDTKSPVEFGLGKTYPVSATVHLNNNPYVKGNFSTIQALATGTFSNVKLYSTGADIANTPTVLDNANFNGGVLENLIIDGNNISNIVGIAPIDEHQTNNPTSYYKKLRINRATYGLYGQDQSTAHPGGFTGSVFDNLYVGAVNGVYLGSNQDDITFNSLRMSITGIGILKAGNNAVFNATYIALTSDTAIGVKLQSTPRTVVFNSLFIESSDKTNFKNQIPIYLNGTASYPVRNIVINGLTLNISTSNNYAVIYSLDVHNDILVNGLTGSFGSAIIGYYLNGNSTNYSSARIITDLTYASTMVYHEMPGDPKRLLTKTLLECLDAKHTIYGQYEVNSDLLAINPNVPNSATTYPDQWGASGIDLTISSTLSFTFGYPNNFNISGVNRATIRNSATSTSNIFITQSAGTDVGAGASGVGLAIPPGQFAVFKRDSTNNLWTYAFNIPVSVYSAAITPNAKANGSFVSYGGTVYLAKTASVVSIG